MTDESESDYDWFDDDDDEFAGFDSDSDYDTEPEVEEKVEECTGNGIYHLAPCQFGAPLAVTWPHFLYANPAIDSGAFHLSD